MTDHPIVRDLIWLILENEVVLIINVSMHFKFLTTNNQVEYKPVIVGLTLTSEIGAKIIKLKTHSHLEVSLIKGEAPKKELTLQCYV